ncbi:hypothetical protein [Arachidicoccus sp.]|uniref:hypothetical protein n=1 Tax=Arachidicoccus sp. TaxID=1872624 RepID=UPI003D1CF6DE
MENNSLDLRVVIGLFFIIISILLLIASFVTANGSETNRITGVIFLVFGIGMYALSKIRKMK